MLTSNPFFTAIAVVVSLACLSAGVGGRPEPKPSAGELLTAMSAKIVCSAVFVTGRDPEDALQNSAARFFGLFQRERITKVEVDRAREAVHLTLDGGLTRTAKRFGDQGCVILPRGREDVFFKPVAVKTALPDAMKQDWPMGDRLAGKPALTQAGVQRLETALDFAFSRPEALTQAMVVVHKGRIVAERYAPGVTKDTQLESWSMGKSITATLAGLLVQQGKLSLEAPAPVAEWQTPADPRAKITLRDLMRMSSGLKFSDSTDNPKTWEHGHPDHLYVYSGAIDVFDFSLNRPLEFPPNTVGRYRNCDALAVGAIIKRTVAAMGQEYLRWPQRALFDRIGIRRQVLEPDPHGNFILTGYDYGTARNWARLGLLYLRDGVWQGKRLLPKGWSRFVSTPAPAWARPEYGALFRLNGTGEWNMPKDAYFMSGGGVSKTIVIPSHDLVIVRMGHLQGTRKYEASFNQALGEILAAIETEKPAGSGRNAQPAGAVEERIRRIENGLLPRPAKDQPAQKTSLADRMNHYKVAGLSIAVINNYRIEWARGYGVTEAGTGAAVTPDTLFQAGSISKPVAAMGALALVERGKLRLDEDANLRLKSWRIPDGEFTRSERVTLRRLLSHTAGMPDIGYIGYGEGREIPTLVQVLDGVKPANTAPTRVVGPPGAKWDYSGAGYTVLQQLMIDAAGKPFPDLMRELVFDKLGMTRSTFEQPLPERFAAAAARGHQPNGARYGARWNVYPEMAAAGLWTTPSDLARFAIELQRAKRGRSRKVLSQTMATHMLTVQPAGGQPSGWGLGVALTGEGRALRFSHSGGTLSFVCNLAAYPETGQGAVVMINSRARGLYEEIFRALAAEYGWPETKP